MNYLFLAEEAAKNPLVDLIVECVGYGLALLCAAIMAYVKRKASKVIEGKEREIADRDTKIDVLVEGVEKSGSKEAKDAIHEESKAKNIEKAFTEFVKDKTSRLEKPSA